VELDAVMAWMFVLLKVKAEMDTCELHFQLHGSLWMPMNPWEEESSIGWSW
jgi:hypothetical protein